MFRLLDMAMMATPGWDMMSSWDKVSAKAVVTVITSTDSEGLVRLLVENDKWLAAFRD